MSDRQPIVIPFSVEWLQADTFREWVSHVSMQKLLTRYLSDEWVYGGTFVQLERDRGRVNPYTTNAGSP